MRFGRRRTISGLIYQAISYTQFPQAPASVAGPSKDNSGRAEFPPLNMES
jgi:hypothetical protein